MLQKIQIGVFGSSGKMGQSIISTANNNYAETVTVIPYYRGGSLIDFIQKTDVILDFSSPEGTLTLCQALSSIGASISLLVGTTGLDQNIQKMLAELSTTCSIMLAPNTSLGATILGLLTRKLSALFDDRCDIEIIDTHHRYKKDAPSGTALMLAEKARQGRNNNHIIITDRSLSQRSQGENEITISSLRYGNTCGEHKVIFAHEFENFSISHKITDRSLFANGAISASLWLIDQSPGLYSFEDMVAGKLNLLN